METSIKSVLLFLTFSLLTIASCAQNKRNRKHTNVTNLSIMNLSGKKEIKSGFWTATKENETVYLQLVNSSGSNNPSFLISFSVDEKDFKKITNDRFELNREAGSIIFNGKFPEQETTGKFSFVKNNDFLNFLDGKILNGISDNKNYYLLKLFLGNITRDYVNTIEKKGYRPTLKQLSKLGVHNVSLAYINGLERTNYKGLELNMLIKFAIHNISVDYIKSLANAGYSNLEPDMLKKFAIYDIDSDYINEIAKAGYNNLDAGMLRKFATHNIDGDYIKSILALNIKKPDANTLQKAKIHNVTSNYVKSVRNEGFESDNLYDYVKLKVRGRRDR